MFALKAWRPDIQHIEEHDITWYLMGFEDGYREYLMTDLEVKEDILRAVDRLLAEVPPATSTATLFTLVPRTQHYLHNSDLASTT